MSDVPRGLPEFIAAWMAHPAYPTGRGGAEFLAGKLAEHGWVQDATDARRAVAEEIAAALEAERPDIGPDAYPTLGAPGALDAFARARTLNEAAFIARFAGGAPLGARYDEPGAVDDMWAALARARERHAETARVAREAGERA